MKKVMSYLIGYRIGGQMLQQMLPGVGADDLVAEMIGRGMVEGLSGTVNPEFLNEKADAYQHEFISMLQARADERGRKNAEIGKVYLEENGKREGVTTTASGLQYEVLVPGGDKKYSPEEYGDAPTAEVMYKGTLVDGTVFDQSRQPVKFNIRQVIPGFTEALKLMPIGAKWKVTIPAELAYGANGPGQIGPNSTLIFEMELLGLAK